MKRRPIIHLRPTGALEQMLHQAATGALRQPLVIDKAAIRRGAR